MKKKQRLLTKMKNKKLMKFKNNIFNSKSKSRCFNTKRHHNNKGLRCIKNGYTFDDVKRLRQKYLKRSETCSD